MNITKLRTVKTSKVERKCIWIAAQQSIIFDYEVTNSSPFHFKQSFNKLNFNYYKE